MANPDLDELIECVVATAASDDPLARLGAAMQQRHELNEVAEAVLDHFVEQARSSGCSWTQIGAELGVTKQAAQQRHGNEQSVARRLLARVLPRNRFDGGSFGGRFSSETRQAVVAAETEARSLGHAYIGSEHLLLGVLQSDGAASFASLGVDYTTARGHVIAAFGEGETDPTGQLPFTPRAKKILERSLRESQQLKHSQVRIDHVLLSIASENDGAAVATLAAMGVNGDRLRAAALERLEDGNGN